MSQPAYAESEFQIASRSSEPPSALRWTESAVAPLRPEAPLESLSGPGRAGGWRTFRTLENISVAECVVHQLAMEGINTIFGIPGGNISPFIQVLRRQKQVRFIIGSHEGGTAFMADGYARATGKLGVCLVTAGPGVTNAITGVASAHLDQVPVLALSGQVSTERFGLSAIQESTDEGGVNTVEMLRHATAYSASIVDPRSFQRLFARALSVAHGTPRSAVHLCFPTNVSRAQLEQVTVPSGPGAYRATVPTAPEAEVAAAFALLRRARRPLLYLGSGAREALESRREEFTAFVRKLGLPVATSLRGKGLFSEKDALSLGVLGMAGSKRAEQYLQEGVDVLLVLGSRLGEWASKSFSTLFQASHTVIHVDARPASIGQFLQTQLPIVADVGAVLAGLYEHARGSTEQDEAARAARQEALHRLSEGAPRTKLASVDDALKPQQLMAELDLHLKGNMDVYVDMGNCTGWATHCLRITPPVRIFYPCGLSSMGWSMGAVIGGKLGRPENVALALTGDGSFLMNGTELITAVRYRVGAVYIVLNDNYLGMVNHGEHAQRAGDFPLDDPYYSLGEPDLVKFAESLGAQAYLVEQPGQLSELLPRVLERADTERLPQVIVARIDHREVPPYGERFTAVAASGGR